MTILDEIVETKRDEICEAKIDRPFDEVRDEAERMPATRPFADAVLSSAPEGVRLIAEIKKQSPSAGLIVSDFDPVRIARTYHEHGAAAISVLTDETYFDGRLGFIADVKQAVPLPVLRKDFLIDEYQVYESRAAGADAVLLIAEILSAAQVVNLTACARRLGMGVLVEFHTEENLPIVHDTLGPPAADRYLLGINNRDLTAQRTDLTTMTRLSRLLPDGARFVAESGMRSRRDVKRAVAAGAYAILVGESLLRAKNIGDKIDKLLGRADA